MIIYIRVRALISYFLALFIIVYESYPLIYAIKVLPGTLGLFFWNAWLYDNLFSDVKLITYKIFLNIGLFMSFSILLVFLSFIIKLVLGVN